METIASVFQSLEDETRLRILALLLEEDELCVCDLMAVLQLPQSTVSRHISHLRNACWLDVRREGVWIYYSLSTKLGPLQQSLVPILSHFLRDGDSGRNDLKRLRGFSRGANCA